MPKFLIIRFSSIGDIIQCMGIIDGIREHFPDAEIHWIARKDMSSFLAMDKRIGKIWAFDKALGLKGLLKIARQLREEHYDYIYDAHSNIRSNILRLKLLPWWSKGPHFTLRSKERWKRFLLFNWGINRFPWPFRGVVSYRKPLLKWGIDRFPDTYDDWYFPENFPEKLNSISPADAMPPAVPWPAVFTGLAFLCIQSWCTHQSFIQRVLAAKNLKEAQKGALFCAFMKILGFMYLALPGIIAFALFQVQGDQVTMMDEAYPQLVTQVIPAPLMGFFAAVMFGAILSSFNSVLNSVNTMFTMDIYKEFIDKEANDAKLVSVGKKVGVIFAVATTIVGPMIYFFPAGLKTFLDSLVMLIGLPVLSAVFGGFFFKHLPKYAAKFVLLFHIVVYGLFLMFMSNSVHYLYAIAVLLPVEILAMFIMDRYNKSKNHAVAWVQEDVNAVDLTPWKYRWVAAGIVVVGVLVVYAAFSPLGLGA